MKWLAGSLGIALGLAAAAELSARRWLPLDALVYQDSANPKLRFELRPKTQGLKGGTWVQINKDGLRDREIPLEKPPGEFRLLVVGDYFTFGYGVPAEETYLRHLESLLKVPKNLHLTTVNLSMYHYNLDQKLEFLRSRGLPYRPDFVILQVYEDDKDDLEAALVRWVRLKNFLRTHSHLIRWMTEKLFWHRVRSISSPPPTSPSASLQEAAKIREGIREFSALLRQNGIPGMVLNFPNLTFQTYAEQAKARAIQQEFRKVSQGQGLLFYDAGEVLQRHPPHALLLRSHEPHLNARGHRTAAQGITQYLRKPFQHLPQIGLKKPSPVG